MAVAVQVAGVGDGPEVSATHLCSPSSTVTRSRLNTSPGVAGKWKISPPSTLQTQDKLIFYVPVRDNLLTYCLEFKAIKNIVISIKIFIFLL